MVFLTNTKRPVRAISGNIFNPAIEFFEAIITTITQVFVDITDPEQSYGLIGHNTSSGYSSRNDF
jgi:hypothetical protein